MPIVGITQSVTREYTPAYGGNRDEKPEDRVVAVFRPLPAAADADLMTDVGLHVDFSRLRKAKAEGRDLSPEEIENELDFKIDPGAAARKGLSALAHSLVELRNYRVIRKTGGDPELWESDVQGDGRQSQAFIDSLPRGLRTELATDALKEENWTEAEVGKSEPSSSEPTEDVQPDAPSARDHEGETTESSGAATNP